MFHKVSLLSLYGFIQFAGCFEPLNPGGSAPSLRHFDNDEYSMLGGYESQGDSFIIPNPLVNGISGSVPIEAIAVFNDTLQNTNFNIEGTIRFAQAYEPLAQPVFIEVNLTRLPVGLYEKKIMILIHPTGDVSGKQCSNAGDPTLMPGQFDVLIYPGKGVYSWTYWYAPNITLHHDANSIIGRALSLGSVAPKGGKISNVACVLIGLSDELDSVEEPVGYDPYAARIPITHYSSEPNNSTNGTILMMGYGTNNSSAMMGYGMTMNDNDTLSLMDAVLIQGNSTNGSFSIVELPVIVNTTLIEADPNLLFLTSDENGTRFSLNETVSLNGSLFFNDQNFADSELLSEASNSSVSHSYGSVSMLNNSTRTDNDIVLSSKDNMTNSNFIDKELGSSILIDSNSSNTRLNAKLELDNDKLFLKDENLADPNLVNEVSNSSIFNSFSSVPMITDYIGNLTNEIQVLMKKLNMFDDGPKTGY